MTKQHWLILGALGLGVLCLYCVGAIFVLQMLSDQSSQIAAALEATPTGATIVPPPLANATTIAPLTPTPQSTARPTATWVIGAPQVPTSAAPASPRAPNTTPSSSQTITATATRRPTVQPVGPIMTAWSKAQNVTAYRIEFDWTIKGNVSDLPAGWDAAKGLPLFGIAGTINGKDSQMAFKGLLAVLFTGDPTKSVEFLTVGDKTYIHGPVPLMGAPENKWYVSTGQGTFTTNVNEGMPELPGDPTID